MDENFSLCICRWSKLILIAFLNTAVDLTKNPGMYAGKIEIGKFLTAVWCCALQGVVVLAGMELFSSE